MTFPHELDVIITSAHLAMPKRQNIIGYAVAAALHEAGLQYVKILTRENDIIIYVRRPGVIVDVNAARYFIPDDLWKAQARHAAGKRTKPGMFTLRAIYLNNR